MKDNKSLIQTIVISALLFVVFPKFEISGSLMPKVFTLGFIVMALIYAVKNFEKNKMTNLIIGCASLYTVWFGISTLYANSGKFAINEYIKILVGFSIFIYIVYSEKEKIDIKRFMWGITSLGAIITFLSIEGASLQIIEPIFEQIFYGGKVPAVAVFNGERINSIYASANPFATMMGVCLFLSLYLYQNASNKIEKYIQAFYLVLFANGIFLVFSMGGTFSLAVGCIAFLILAPIELRIKGLLTIIQVALIGLLSVISTLGTYVSSHISGYSSGSPLPILAIILGTITFIALEQFVNPKISHIILKYVKKVAIATVSIVVIGILSVIIVLTQTTSSIISPTDIYIRTVYLDAGIYNLDIDFFSNSDSAKVTIYTRDEEQVLLGGSTAIFAQSDITNDSKELEFEILDNVQEVNIRIANESDTNIQVDKIAFIGDKTVNIMLSHKFLPENITSRLQGLQTNNSLATRIQYVEDSMLLFAKSPIIGHGLGGFENAIQSVQKYQYETKYAHNHFAQTLVDGGLIGFISYTLLIGSCLFAVVKSRKTNDLSPVLFGALMVILVHGTTEFSMSISFFIPFAFAVFALTSVTCDIEISKISMHNGKILAGVVSVLSLLSVFLTGNLIANANISGQSVTLDTLENCASLDIYEKNDYMLSYVLSTANINDENIQKTSQNYLSKLEKAKSNTISKYLATYYIDKGDATKSYEQLTKYLDYSIYDPDTWNDGINIYASKLFSFENLGSFVENKDIYVKNIQDYIYKLAQTNDTAISKIVIEGENLSFIRRVLATNDLDDIGEIMSYVTNVVYDSKYDTDLNGDGWYDAMYKEESYKNVYEDISLVPGNRIRVRVPYSEDGIYKMVYDGDNIITIAAPSDLVEFEVVDGQTILYVDTTDFGNMRNTTDGLIDLIITFKWENNEFSRLTITKDNQ